MSLGVIARVLTGLVFLVAGAAKLRDPGWPAAAAALGTPGVIAPVVPWVEILVGAGLVAGLGGPALVAVAVSLLVVFTAALVRSLARGGDQPVCSCFGAWSAEPVGPRSVVRNGALIGLAALGFLA